MEGKKLQATTVVEEGSADPWVLSTAVGILALIHFSVCELLLCAFSVG